MVTTLIDIYRGPEARDRCLQQYEAVLALWPVVHEEVDVETPFGRTHVIVSGPPGAPSLVLLHGQWTTATMWAPVVGPLSSAFRVYATDQIDDVGKSAPTRMPSSRSDYADWLEAVLDGLGLGTVNLGGLSYGGFLAANLALRDPRRVRRLALLCPGLPSLGRPKWGWALHGTPVTLLPGKRSAEWLVRGLSARGYVLGDPTAEQLIAGALGARARVPMRPKIGDGEFATLSMPVLLLVGDAEKLYDARKATSRASQLIAGVTTLVIPGAGHMLCADQPERVASELTRFFTGNEPGNATVPSNKRVQQNAAR